MASRGRAGRHGWWHRRWTRVMKRGMDVWVIRSLYGHVWRWIRRARRRRTVRHGHGVRITRMDHVRRGLVITLGGWRWLRTIRPEGEWSAGAWLGKRKLIEVWGYFDALSGQSLIEIVEVETRDVTLQESIALEELLLDPLGMAPGNQCLPVPVLLMAGCSSRSASRTSRMFRITLQFGVQVSKETWKLPSVSPDGTCLDLFAPAPSASLMGASETSRLRGCGCLITVAFVLFTLPCGGLRLGSLLLNWLLLRKLRLIRIHLER
jgi:hypothetical protein